MFPFYTPGWSTSTWWLLPLTFGRGQVPFPGSGGRRFDETHRWCHVSIFSCFKFLLIFPSSFLCITIYIIRFNILCSISQLQLINIKRGLCLRSFETTLSTYETSRSPPLSGLSMYRSPTDQNFMTRTPPSLLNFYPPTHALLLFLFPLFCPSPVTQCQGSICSWTWSSMPKFPVWAVGCSMGSYSILDCEGSSFRVCIRLP